jgi:hypothetical protein
VKLGQPRHLSLRCGGNRSEQQRDGAPKWNEVRKTLRGCINAFSCNFCENTAQKGEYRGTMPPIHGHRKDSGSRNYLRAESTGGRRALAIPLETRSTLDAIMPSRPSAPAKINLFLHVGSARADGYHPIESLVAFADCGDDLQFSPGGDAFSIQVSGPFANAAGDPEQNLVLKAARALKKKLPGIGGGKFSLTKNLPAGAGLGGGSSDAAAALRLIAKENSVALNDLRTL